MKNVICPSVGKPRHGVVLLVYWDSRDLPVNHSVFVNNFDRLRRQQTHIHTHTSPVERRSEFWRKRKKHASSYAVCFCYSFLTPKSPHPLNGLDCWIRPSLAPRANGLLRVSWRSIPPTWKYIEKGEEDEWKRKTSGPGLVERRKDTAKQFPFRRRWFQLPKKVLKNILFIFFC